MKVGVIMGGISTEREISLKSGRSVVENIDRSKYDVVEIVLDSKTDIFEKAKGLDFALLMLHGKFGEDGTIQSILEAMDIPYSGCGPLTSALCMDKNMCKKVLKSAGILTAPWTTAKSIEGIDYDKINEMGYPVFIKPNSGGSSVATFMVKSQEEVEPAVKAVLEVDKEAIIEGYIKGNELTSFILNGEVFPTIEISTDKEFFNFEAKYATDGSGAREEVVFLEEDLQNKINIASKQCWSALNCEGYARVDFIVQDGVPYVLEINTLPGMTTASLIPKSAKGKGMEYSELVDKLIEYSMNVRR